MPTRYGKERLPSMRVSPSGKARASQARIRGFESRHPLQISPHVSVRYIQKQLSFDAINRPFRGGFRLFGETIECEGFAGTIFIVAKSFKRCFGKVW